MGPRLTALMDYAQAPIPSRASFVMWVETVLALEPIANVDARDATQRAEVNNFQLLEDPALTVYSPSDLGGACAPVIPLESILLTPAQCSRSLRQPCSTR